MKIRSSFRTALIAAGVVLFFAYGCWDAFLRTTNEIGPVGADKAGRQILLQTLDDYFRRGNDSTTTGYALDVTSEFDRVPLPIRFLKEPMRTTFVLRYRVKQVGRAVDSTFADRLLAAPSDILVNEYRGPVSMTRERDVPPDTLRARLRRLGVESVGQFLAAFGFRKLEVEVDGSKVIERNLPAVGKGNSKWSGT